MSLQKHMMWAETAVKYVEGKITYGAANKPIDQVHRQQRHVQPVTQHQINAMRQAASLTCPPAFANATRGTPGMVQKVCHFASIAEGGQIGNCGEQSSVAFNYLVITKGYHGIALFSLGVNHEFIVIGMNPPPPPAPPGAAVAPVVVAVNAPPAWGNDAVVCDPWFHEWFAVQADWTRKVRRILAATEPNNANPANVSVKLIAYQP